LYRSRRIILPVLAAQTADIDSIVFVRAQNTRGEHQHAQNRGLPRIEGWIVPLIHDRMEQRLDVHRDGKLPRRDEVLEMHVVPAEGMKNRQISPEPFVKPRNFLTARAWLVIHELRPPVAAAVDHFERAESRLEAALIHPFQKLGEMHIERHATRLVDQLQAGGETEGWPLSALAVGGFLLRPDG